MPASGLPDLEGLVLPDLSDRVVAGFPIRWAEATPDAPALIFPAEGISWTYRDFVGDASQISAGYQGIGLTPGDRLGIMLGNRSEYALAWFGAQFNAMVDVAINHGLRHDMLIHQIRSSGVRAVVCDAESFDALVDVADDIPGVEFIFPVEPVKRTGKPGRLRVHGFDLLSDERTAGKRTLSGPTDVTSIRYTSGTTGPAKAVANTNSQKIVSSFIAGRVLGAKASDRLYTPFPLHHSLASMMGMVACFQVGACCIVDSRFSASRYWKNIGNNSATLAQVLTPMLPMLMAQDPDEEVDRGHSCRKLWTAFSNPAFEERFGVELIPHYSMSEAAPVAFPWGGAPSHSGSCGKVGPLFDVRVVDHEEQPVLPGVHGEIFIRPTVPHTIMEGYYGDPAATARAWRGLWYHTGDEGYLDDDRCLFLVGRMGDQIRRRGVNISAEHIEQVARAHDSVVDAAAIAVPAEFGESEIKLVLLGGSPEVPDIDQFAAFLREQLPAEMVPRYLEWRSDLPRTTTQKVSKAELRREGVNGITDATVDLRGR